MSDIKKIHMKLVEDFIEKTKNLLQEKLDDDCIAIDVGTNVFVLSELFMEKSGLKLSKIIVNKEAATGENFRHAIYDIESSLPDELKSEAPFDLVTSFTTHFGNLKTALLNVNSLLRPNGVFCLSIAIHNCLSDLCDELAEKHSTYKDKIINCLKSLGGNEKLSEELPKMLSECEFTVDYFEVMPITHNNEENDDLKEFVDELLPFLKELSSEDAELISSDCCALLKVICENNENNQLVFLHCVATKNSSNYETGNDQEEEEEAKGETEGDIGTLEEEKDEEIETKNSENDGNIEAQNFDKEETTALENLDYEEGAEDEEKKSMDEENLNLGDENEAEIAATDPEVEECEETHDEEKIGEALILEKEEEEEIVAQGDQNAQEKEAGTSKEKFV